MIFWIHEMRQLYSWCATKTSINSTWYANILKESDTFLDLDTICIAFDFLSIKKHIEDISQLTRLDFEVYKFVIKHYH